MHALVNIRPHDGLGALPTRHVGLAFAHYASMLRPPPPSPLDRFSALHPSSPLSRAMLPTTRGSPTLRWLMPQVRATSTAVIPRHARRARHLASRPLLGTIRFVGYAFYRIRNIPDTLVRFLSSFDLDVCSPLSYYTIAQLSPFACFHLKSLVTPITNPPVVPLEARVLITVCVATSSLSISQAARAVPSRSYIHTHSLLPLFLSCSHLRLPSGTRTRLGSQTSIELTAPWTYHLRYTKVVNLPLILPKSTT